jgi:N-acetylneuraminic acid mutarotase
MKTKFLFLFGFIILHSSLCLPVCAQGTAFTYQGRLDESSGPANGSYDFTFALFSTSSGVDQVGNTTTNMAVGVTNGLFTVTLDFGSQFPGAARWLEIGVRTNGGGDYVTLSPRQPLTAAPYAIAAGNVTGPIDGGSIVVGTITSTQLAPGAAAQNLEQGGYGVSQGENIVLSPAPASAALVSAGYSNITGWTEVNATEVWTQRGTNAPPAARWQHTAVWTGREMIVWGGWCNGTVVNTGARYNPSNDTWTAMTTDGAPSARRWHTAIWTGTEMIVWGGWDGTSVTNSGARYNPVTDTWTDLPASDRPPGAINHTGVWTGTEMIVFGGTDGDLFELNTGGRYDPATDAWTPISGPYLAEHTAVWTGSRMILWGGQNDDDLVQNYLALYDPVNNSWSYPSPVSPPAVRKNHTATWTGSEMIVWGGFNSVSRLNTGGRYNPATGTWAATTTTGAPAGRDFHTAVWTGVEMIIWGGENGSVPLNTGGRYNPVLNSWTASSTFSPPPARYYHTAVNAGHRMLIFGGTANGFLCYDDLGAYNFPKRALYVYEKP